MRRAALHRSERQDEAGAIAEGLSAGEQLVAIAHLRILAILVPALRARADRPFGLVVFGGGPSNAAPGIAAVA